MAVLEPNDRVLTWVATQVMPYEWGVRAWLRKSSLSAADIDDLVQEAYCRLFDLDSVDHINRPDAYFFLIARNLLHDRLRRARVVRIEAVQEVDALNVFADEPTPEDVTSGRRELARVRNLIAALPTALRQVVELRKIDGLSQKEIAVRLGITEARVEHLGVRAMKQLSKAMTETGVWDETTIRRRSDARSRNRRRD
jgi:RNA polymerase sigma factor (sigma-70 family)